MLPNNIKNPNTYLSYIYISTCGLLGIVLSFVGAINNYLFSGEYSSIILKILVALSAIPSTGLIYTGTIALFADIFLLLILFFNKLKTILKLPSNIHKLGLGTCILLIFIYYYYRFSHSVIMLGLSLYNPEYSDNGASFIAIFNIIISIFSFIIPLLFTIVLDLCNIRTKISNKHIKNLIFVGFCYTTIYLFSFIILGITMLCK